MATTTIPWDDGSGDNIYLTYPSTSEDQIISVSSDANTDWNARKKSVTISASDVSPVTLTINQEPGIMDVPYIRNSSLGAYINTGITADNTVKVIVWARNWNAEAGFLFGSRVNTSQNTFGLFSGDEQNSGSIRIDYAQGTTQCGDNFSKLSHFYKYELYQGVAKVNDVVVGSREDSTFSNNLAIHLFGLNGNGSHTSPVYPVDIIACKIYKHGELVRDYKAVNTPSIGLYDSVSETTFTNSGSGTFTYGTFRPSAYIPIEYITASEAQWFDTGIKGKSDMRYVVKFMCGNNGNQNWPVLLGAQTTSSSGRYELSFGSSSNKYSSIYWAYNTWSVSSNQTLKNVAFVAKMNGRYYRLYKNNSQVFGSYFSNASFTTAYNLYVSAINRAGTAAQYYGGRIYYVGLQSQRNFVPAKVNDVAGMYDTYNDVFYPSITSTPFVAGPEL